MDRREDRSSFTDAELELITKSNDQACLNGFSYAVFLRGRDLSGHGGVWRVTLGEGTLADNQDGWRQLGIEAVTYLVLVSTLVYLEFAPSLRWDHANYLR